MCNRFRQVKTKENLSLIFEARDLIGGEMLEGDRYPSSRTTMRLGFVVRKQEGERVLDALPWGVPASIKTPTGGRKLTWVTNVRNLTSGHWRSALSNPVNRCLVPFTSFAEPKPGMGGDGRPACWWFNLPSSDVAAFAGIWRSYTVDHKGELLTGVAFAFLTCEPNPLVKPLHSKAMPVILQPEDYDTWLDADTDSACSLAQPFPSQLMAVA